MDFGFLFDTSRQLLSIGYQVANAALDAYDLLASEAQWRLRCDREEPAGITLVQTRRTDAGPRWGDVGLLGGIDVQY